MCCGGGSRSLSRLSITTGVLSLVTLALALLSNSWLYTREPVRLPQGNQGTTTITFKIGFWRVCPNLRRITTSPSTLLPSPGCQMLHYADWKEVKEADLGIFWSTLEFTPSFVTKMRYAMPLVVLAMGLLSLATLFALVGHCNSDLKTLVACGLYTLGGLTLASGLVVFVSVLSDVYMAADRRQLEYRYGWSFQAAGASFILSEVAALVSITAYLRRFSSVEEMVRAVVPGADRKIRHHQLYRSKHNNSPLPLPLPPTPPDICTTKSHDTAVVLPEHEPYRYTTIIHQGLLGVAEGTSSSGGSTVSSGGTCSSHSLPRPLTHTRLHPQAHALTHAHTLDCKRHSKGYYTAVT